jgi:hypothetical protein
LERTFCLVQAGARRSQIVAGGLLRQRIRREVLHFRSGLLELVIPLRR